MTSPTRPDVAKEKKRVASPLYICPKCKRENWKDVARCTSCGLRNMFRKMPC